MKKEKGRHLPIFPGRLQPSIFGTIELNFCVRDGNRCDLDVIGTGHAMLLRDSLSLTYSLFFCKSTLYAPSKLNIETAMQNHFVVKPSTY